MLSASFHPRQLLTFEAAFIAFLFAGIYNSHSALEWFPINITGFWLIVVLLLSAILLACDKWHFSPILLILCGLYGLLYFWLTITVLWSPSSVYATDKLIRLITIIPGVIIGGYIISQDPQRFRRFLRVLLLSSLTMVIITLYFGLIGDLSRGLRFAGSDYLLPSRLLAIGGLISLYWVSRADTRNQHLLLSGSLFLHLLAVAMAGSRGALIALIIAMAVFFIFRSTSWQRPLLQLYPETKTVLTVVSISVVLLAMLSVFYSSVLNRVRGIRRLLSVLDPRATDTGAQSRLEMYSAAYNFWMDLPSLIVGNGIGSFAVLDLDRDVQHYPHNILLEILVESGLVGFTLFLLIIAVGMFRLYSYRKFHSNAFISFILAFFAFWFVSAMFSGDLSDNRYVILGIVLFCCSFRTKYTSARTGN